MSSESRTPTVHDVASASGFSRSTVSRVLNDPSGAPAVTRERVLAAAKALGYRASPAARALRQGRIPMVALCAGDVSQPFFGSLAKSLGRATEEAGLGLMLIDLDRDITRLGRTLDRVNAWSLQGVVIATANDLSGPDVTSHLKGLQGAGARVVTASQALPYSGIPAVIIDHAGVAYQATRHLLDGGAESVALIAGDEDSPLTVALRRGYEDALSSARTGLGSAPPVLYGGHDLARAAGAITAFVADGPLPDAFVVGSAYAALALAEALNGVSESKKIVCCEHVPLLEHLQMPVASIGVDFDEYADLLVTTLVTQSPASTPVLQIVPPALLHDERSSVSLHPDMPQF